MTAAAGLLGTAPTEGQQAEGGVGHPPMKKQVGALKQAV
jgi:hypothetical protein